MAIETIRAVGLDPYDLVGTSIGSFQVQHVVGVGGHGVVYRAVTPEGRPRAIKCLDVSGGGDRATLLRDLQRESVMLEFLSGVDAGIVQCHSFGVHETPGGDWIPYLVMEWLDGVTLDTYFKEIGPLAAPAAVSLLTTAARAIAAAHDRAIVHHDIKPQNIFVLRDAHGLRLKVVDFGLARTLGPRMRYDFESTGQVSTLPAAFTWAYGTPEQFDRDLHGRTSRATDVFALALVLVETITGRRALSGTNPIQLYRSCAAERRPTPRALGVDAGAELERVIATALSVEQSARYRTVGEFWAAVQAAVAERGEPRVVDPYTVTDVMPRVSAKHCIYAEPDQAARGHMETDVLTPLSHPFDSWTWHEVDSSGADPLPPPATDSLVVVLLTFELAKSGYLTSEAMRELCARHHAGDLRVVPILLDDLHRSHFLLLLEMVILPRFSQPLRRWADQETGWRDVTESLAAVLQEVQDSGRHRAIVADGSARPPPGPPNGYPVFEVFKPNGTPALTFVPTKSYYQLVDTLRVPGRGVVVEGPSGVGKTTALHNAVEKLKQILPGAGDIQVLHARGDEPRIRRLAQWHRSGIVAIDDFHCLDRQVVRTVTDYMKRLADEDRKDRKVVVAGIPGTGAGLVELTPDVANRVEVIPFGKADVSEIISMINRGEAALNVRFARKADIAVAAAGSFNTAHLMCLNICQRAGLEMTVDNLRVLEWMLPGIVEQVREFLALKMRGLTRAFAEIGDGVAGLRVLKALAVTPDGSLRLDRQYHHQLNADIAVLLRDAGDLAARLSRTPGLEQLIFVDQRGRKLVAEDPQVSFYFARSTLAQLFSAGDVPFPTSERLAVVHHLAHEADREVGAELEGCLRQLEGWGISVRCNEVRSGPRLVEEFAAQLQGAVAGILLVSDDYFGSFNADALLKALRTRRFDGTLILPVLLRASPRYERSQMAREFPAAGGGVLEAASTRDRARIGSELARRVRAHVQLMG